MNSTTNIKFGYVISYYPERGFGFIRDNDEEDEYFFHISNLEKPFEIIPYKTNVTFNVTQNSKGSCAVNIKRYYPKIEGKFGEINFPNSLLHLTNRECYEYLKNQHEKIQALLDSFRKTGIEVSVATNGWMTLDWHFCDEIEDITPAGGKWESDVPSGYPDTFEHLFNLLQKQINYYNRAYNSSLKGIQGEEKTSQSIKAISINYPVLHNVLLEEGTEENRYSAETDTIIITDRAIFLIETKNYGGKGDKITVAEDGRWTIFDRYQKKSIPIKNNPYKQVTDHIFVIRKFLEKHRIKEDLPIIPIIAIANNDVIIEVENKGLSKILRTDLIGTYILQYLESHPTVISKKTMGALSNIFDEEKLPPKKYRIIDYFENIKTVVANLMELVECYKEDAILQDNNDKKQREKEKQLKKKQADAEEGQKEEKTTASDVVLGVAVKTLQVLKFVDDIGRFFFG